MRCPKCGYISFDHMEKCLKCNKSIKETSGSLHGSVFRAPAPSFLQLTSAQDEDARENGQEAEDTFDNDQDFIDDDLEVLVQDETPTVESAISMDESEEENKDDEIEMEDREIAMDLSALGMAGQKEEEKDEPLSTDDKPGQEGLSLEFPAELADISDLAPPTKTISAEDVVPPSSNQKEPEQLSLEDLDFDLGLGDLEMGAGSNAGKETVLALDDIDFSEALGNSRERKPASKPAGTDMDSDLDFELDLGGLSLLKDK